jgi:hypothetical protein
VMLGWIPIMHELYVPSEQGHKSNLFQIVCKKNRVKLIQFFFKSFKCEYGALIHYENIHKIYLVYLPRIYSKYVVIS